MIPKIRKLFLLNSLGFAIFAVTVGTFMFPAPQVKAAQTEVNFNNMEYLAIKNMSLFLCMGNRRGGCFSEAENLTAPYIPSSRIRDGFRFRVAPWHACKGRNEGGTKGRRRWATCAAFCANNPRCVSFEMGAVTGPKSRRCHISYSCTGSNAVGHSDYDLWIIDRP